MIRKWTAGLLAGAMLLALMACQPPAESAAPSPQDTAGDQYIIVPSEREEADSPYAAEFPAIGETLALTGTPAVRQTATASASEEVRAVWVSYLEMARLLEKKSAAQFTKNFEDVLDNIEGMGLNTVIVQVRPFGDALYDSDYFPWSYTITGKEGKDPGFDPLEIMVDGAKARGLRIEAWINPYRVRAKGNTNALSADNKAKQWLAAGNGAAIKYDGATSYNPASEEARNLIISGVVEIVRNYDVDGVHIDDYFYPTTDAAFDKASYTAYKNGGGSLSLAAWRRSNVEKLVKGIYNAVKAENPGCLFGVSPQSSVENNYSQQYLDVKKIAGNDGYCDYICPQIYFGYDNAVQPYKQTLELWSDMVSGSSVELYVGLGAYKVGKTDSWAGSGKYEWANNTDLMNQMVADARAVSDYRGFVLYRYDSVFHPEKDVKSAVQKETDNLRRIL